MNTIRYLAALAAGSSALFTFLSAYPGEIVPTLVLVIVGGVSTALAAIVAVLINPALVIAALTGRIDGKAIDTGTVVPPPVVPPVVVPPIVPPLP